MIPTDMTVKALWRWIAMLATEGSKLLVMHFQESTLETDQKAVQIQNDDHFLPCPEI